MGKKKGKSARKPPAKCIFCGGGPISKEHIFPDWMREIFPRTDKDTHRQGTVSWGLDGDGKPKATPKVERKQGHAAGKRPKVTCIPCNNRWISTLDRKTKPLLVRLMKSQSYVLSIDEQQLLATWLTKMTMVIDAATQNAPAVPAEQRAYLKANLEPPEGWDIWVASNGAPGWATMLFHHASEITEDNLPPEAPIRPKRTGLNNAQTTTIGMAAFFTHVFSSKIPGFGIELQDEGKSALRRLWPLTGRALAWPTAVAISDNRADYIADGLARFLGLPLVMANRPHRIPLPPKATRRKPSR